MTTRGPLLESVDAAFAAEGPLRRAVASFEARPGQRALAAAVAGVFEAGGQLVAEAGTGIGKTLAYLVPALLDRRRVLVSTGTRTLQDQVFYKDLPGLIRALGVDARAAYMKGRTNYLCRHRLERLQDSAGGMNAGERSWLARIREWAAVTDTGDRGEIDDLPDDLPLWTELTATREQCLGRDCPSYQDCFVTRMRDAAEAADIVVVNHHLLCADASVRGDGHGEVIPDCDLAVIDEAHQLEEIVTQHFGVAVSTFRLEEFVRDAVQTVTQHLGDDPDRASTLRRAIAEIQETSHRLFDAVRRELPPTGAADRQPVSPAMAAALAGPAGDLAESCGRLEGQLRTAADSPDLDAMAARARSLRDDLGQVVAESDAAVVRFVERRGRGLFLRAAPIDVGPLIRDLIAGPRAATVFTSATLAVDRSFDYALSRLGLPEARTVRVPAEFDYTRQSILYLPPDMPDPRSPAFNAAASDTVAALLERSRGRAFVLFTSHAAMRDVHARLTGAVPWPLLLQGTAPRSALLREFRATPHAVLLATSSFWQGIDVAGDALSCVVIDRLPFASPADPLVAARLESVAASGRHPFRDYQVPLATLTLLQGLGRLIRSRRDRGVLAVLDPRLTGMHYGRRFLASLPPAPITRDLAAVEAFFANAPPT